MFSMTRIAVYENFLAGLNVLIGMLSDIVDSTPQMETLREREMPILIFVLKSCFVLFCLLFFCFLHCNFARNNDNNITPKSEMVQIFIALKTRLWVVTHDLIANQSVQILRRDGYVIVRYMQFSIGLTF